MKQKEKSNPASGSRMDEFHESQFIFIRASRSSAFRKLFDNGPKVSNLRHLVYYNHSELR
jgi:hypothetical protein